MRILIAHTDFQVTNKKTLFILARPFFKDGSWVDASYEKGKSGLDSEFCLTEDISKAEVVLIPFPINWYYKNKKVFLLKELNLLCQKYDVKAYSYISDDFGIAFPEFSNIIYFRMGGFKTQVSKNNKGFPVGYPIIFTEFISKKPLLQLLKGSWLLLGFAVMQPNHQQSV